MNAKITLLLLALTTAGFASLVPSASATGTLGCSQSYTRDSVGGSAHEHDCTVAVNEGGWTLCLGYNERWQSDPTSYRHTVECDRGVKL